jgi:putative nucleotidyltransferase with HDIG domain
MLKIKESTRQRCTITQLDEKARKRLQPVSLEFFHFLYQTKELPFSIFCRIENTLIEYVSPGPLVTAHLDDLWDLMRRPETDCEICIRKVDKAAFDALMGGVRAHKLELLSRQMPNLDKKTLDVFANLSAASQMVVAGGINADVAQHVKASAAFLVSNAIDSDQVVATLSRMINCDPTLYDHSATVAMLAAAISLRLLPKQLSGREAELVAQCALYHDVGKTCVPHEILNKPGKFTPAEFDIMKQHTTLGHSELMKLIDGGVSIDELVARVALEHHERWDGSGYPHGRRGPFEADAQHGIHLYTRIVMIADVYSALLMRRVYKPAFQPQDAIRIMAQEANGFDPDVFKPFLKCVVRSLNKDESHTNRLLVIGENGELSEWQSKKAKSA